MLDGLVSWTFWVLSIWVAFQLGQWWNERDVAESIAAITERQARRRSQELVDNVREPTFTQELIRRKSAFRVLRERKNDSRSLCRGTSRHPRPANCGHCSWLIWFGPLFLD